MKCMMKVILNKCIIMQLIKLLNLTKTKIIKVKCIFFFYQKQNCIAN